MATVPNPPTQTAGSPVPASTLNSYQGGILFLVGSGTNKRPLFVGRTAGGQSLATSGTAAALTLEIEDVDTDNGHSTTTNTSRYTAQTAGWYQVTGIVSYNTNATGTRGAQLWINGTQVPGCNPALPAVSDGHQTAVPVETLLYLNVGDYLELYGWQTSGGALSISAARLTAMWISQ